jgi:hypothetical protein
MILMSKLFRQAQKTVGMFQYHRRTKHDDGDPEWLLLVLFEPFAKIFLENITPGYALIAEESAI